MGKPTHLRPSPRALSSLLGAFLCAPLAAEDWPQWRGPEGTGVSEETQWSSKAQGELFGVELGPGYSSPSIVGGALSIQGFDPDTRQDRLVGMDAGTGEVLWTHVHASKLWNNMHEGSTLTTPTEDGVCWTAPVLCDGRVDVRNNKGTLVCTEHRAPTSKRSGTGKDGR